MKAVITYEPNDKLGACGYPGCYEPAVDAARHLSGLRLPLCQRHADEFGMVQKVYCDQLEGNLN
jgi:hypothetical protein